MIYSLTDKQKDALRWIVAEVGAGLLDEEFSVSFSADGDAIILGHRGKRGDVSIRPGTLQALAAERLMIVEIKPLEIGRGTHVYFEERYYCTLLKDAFEAVDSDFGALLDLHKKEEFSFSRGDLAKLAQLLENGFAPNDLDTLCFGLGIKVEEIPGDTKGARIREVLLHASRRKLLFRLIAKAVIAHPHLDWGEI